MDLFERAVTGEVRTYRLEKRYVHADGHLVWGLLNVSAVPAAGGGVAYLIGQIEDISERKAAEATLTRLALHDGLTGLANRSLLTDRLGQAVRRCQRDGGSFALLFVDLDHFKAVNDRFGHEAGDRLLCAVADRLVANLRPPDTCARLGGDEFVILAEGVQAEEARSLAGRLGAAVGAPWRSGGHEATVTASVGVVIAGAAAADPQALLRDADAAMYRAKRAGKDRFEVLDLTQQPGPAEGAAAGPGAVVIGRAGAYRGAGGCPLVSPARPFVRRGRTRPHPPARWSRHRARGTARRPRRRRGWATVGPGESGWSQAVLSPGRVRPPPCRAGAPARAA